MTEKALIDLAQEVKTNDALAREMKADPQAALVKQAAAYADDRTFYRIAIVGLVGVIVLTLISAVVVQVWKGETVSDWESALATTALGGLVGLLAPVSK